MIVSRQVRVLAVMAACAVFVPMTALGADKRVRLTVTVSVEGSEGVVGNGNDKTSGKFREGYTLVTYLETDGELQQFNTKDPQYARKMMGLSQNVQQNVRAVQGKAPVKKMTQQQIQDYVQK
jgi:hypothetical protein